MDIRINRINQACAAAERIINMVECTGYDITDPSSIINGWDYCSMPDYMQYSYGASRLVVWDTEYCDYVVKVALNDRYEKFCQHEVEVYQAAVEEGLDAQFAWCMCYSEPRYNNEGEYEVPGIYVMEYVDCDEEAAEDITWKYGYEQYCSLNGLNSSDFDSADAYNDWNQGETEERVLDYMESLMSPEYRRAFEVFMCKWWITDIHTQNVGFKGPNMVMVDYAGWNW